jgi:DNA/RNA endonuclease G (NUC1)
VRKTYYRYKERAIAVSEIEQLEDMVKLKNAKTSTRERLAKTIRK